MMSRFFLIKDASNSLIFLIIQSLILSPHCKLELWDSHRGLGRGDNPDLVIDREKEFRNLYVDSLSKVDEFKHLDEKISAYR